MKQAMNEINSAKRLKFAVAEKAEGQKILQVKSAEAEAEAKYLSGVGVAKQRKAIVDGLRSSIVDFNEGVKGASSKDVMDLLLLTQYFDCIRDVGSAGHCKTTFVPSGKSGVLLKLKFPNKYVQADNAGLILELRNKLMLISHCTSKRSHSNGKTRMTRSKIGKEMVFKSADSSFRRISPVLMGGLARVTH